VGLADAADSLAAIKKIVFEEGILSISTVLEALAADFKGYEQVRHTLLKCAPKYGNNDPSVDRLARSLSSFFCKEVGQYGNPRGGVFVPGLYSVSANVPIGRYVGATPDGRRAFTPVAEACSPTHGSDVHGPTQAALSVAHLDHIVATNGTQYNQKYHPSVLEGIKGTQSLVDLVQTFFEEGGYHIQFNVVSGETLRKAQKNPEKYRDLVIRVAGYSAFFVDLDETIQEDIIQRTEFKF
jgi:formate C-acetyltransferase